ncbi:MAG: hypothetical protein PHE89_03235 [Alphaproteobacteria bacterium]|nr:hypothetical protein [Alphaproteobacteria bacterium]
MRGCNVYVFAGTRSMELDEQFDAKTTALQAMVGAQWEIVSTFFEHSPLQVAIGPKFGFHNLDYSPIKDNRWYGFCKTFGGTLNVDYKVTESFAIGVYADYTQFSVKNEYKVNDKLTTVKVDYKTQSIGFTLTYNFNVKVK